MSAVVDSPWNLSAGLKLGTAWLRQSFETPELAPTRNRVAAHVGALIRAAVPLGKGLYLTAELNGKVYVFAQQLSRIHERHQ